MSLAEWAAAKMGTTVTVSGMASSGAVVTVNDDILIVGPGNYKFSDFFKVGWLLVLLSFGVLLLGLKLFWGM